MRPIAVDEQWGKASSIPLKMRAQLVTTPQPEEWELMIATPDNFPTPRKKTAFFTMYESTEMPPQYVQNLNRSTVVIVPCQWCKENFEENGVRTPIEVVPLGYDPNVFQATPVRVDGPTIFGVAGRTRHCARRKAVQEAVDLFRSTFEKDDDVRLHVKVHPDDEANCTDYRVKIEKRHFEPYEIDRWLGGLTCFVTLARGEGFALWPLQAMACGRPVIGAKYSGQADFMMEANSYIAKHRVVDAVSGQSNVQYLGQWGEIDLKSARQKMLEVREGSASAREVGLTAAAWVKGWTWESTAKKLLAVLEKHGAL